MEKKTTKKRPVKAKIDTKNVDVTFEKDSEGNATLEIDTEKTDITVTKKASGGVKVEVEIDDKLVYEFESNGNSKHMPKGKIFKVTGEMVKLFLKRGFGNLKK